MSPTTPSYIHPTSEDYFWVFWSKEGDKDCLDQTKTLSSCDLTETRTIDFNFKEYLLPALRKCASIWDNYKLGFNILVQIWAPKTIGGQLMLTTSHQPFALRRIEKGICEYRKHSINLEFNVNGDGEEFGGVIGQVFRHEKMASYSEIKDYSVKQYPLRDFALKCGVWSSFAAPVFYPSGRCCAGVLEFVDTRGGCMDQYISLFWQATGLLEIKESTEERVIIGNINKELQVVCTTHQLPLAQIWIPCCTSPDELCYFLYVSCSDKFSSSMTQDGMDVEMEDFHALCCDEDLMKGQGVVGKAFSDHKPCFCRDVTQLSTAQYPFSNYALNYKLTGCYAICLHSTLTRNHNYVLEFYLPPNWNTIPGDPQTFLKSLSTTVKKRLPGFKICSGEGPFVEVGEISLYDDESDSLLTSQTTGVHPIPESFANEREKVQNQVVVGETVIDNGSDILGLKQNGTIVEKTLEILRSDIGEEVGEELFVEVAKTATNVEMTTMLLPPMSKPLQNEAKVVQLSDDKSTMGAGRKNGVNVIVSEQNVMAVTSSGRTHREETSERKYRTTDCSLSCEDLKQHFGKKLDDAAAILGVSRSTMKRACRVHGIEKWPFPKRKKVKPSPSNLKHINKFILADADQIPKFGNSEPSCSESPPVHPTGVVSHTIPSVAPKQDAGSVTVKATYGVEIIRFQLSFSSTRVDLVEKVTKRFPLKDGTFNIKYEDDYDDWVLIACDEDLEECIGISKGKSIIKMLVQPITNGAP